jgi:hypothetical protein
MVNQNILILRPKFNIFWAIFIRLFLTFNTSVIRHLLLLQYWTEESDLNGNHSQTEIIGFRNQLERLLTNNLQNYLNNELEKIYKGALKYVKQKTRFKIDFPEHCPYSLEQLLDEDYFQ